MKTLTFAWTLGLILLVVICWPLPNGVSATASDKWSLWQDGPHLRGANIYQRRSYPDADGDLANVGPVIPPYSQADFNKLAAMGANYVNISHPGLFTETPPYTVDMDMQDNLGKLLQMIANANLYAVISFRTGPGRNEFTFLEEEDSSWLGYSKDINFVWPDPNDATQQDEQKAQAAQDAWAAMWQYTANYYQNNPNVVGYDLMVEPNSNQLHEIYDPAEFYPKWENSLYDWNQLYPKITTAIRQVDSDTPILIGGMDYSSIYWLSSLQPTTDTHTIYTVHIYDPYSYTHEALSHNLNYPGIFDADGDGTDEMVDRDWLDNLLAPIDKFKADHHVPVAVNEYGPKRWQPGAAQLVCSKIMAKRRLRKPLGFW